MPHHQRPQFCVGASTPWKRIRCRRRRSTSATAACAPRPHRRPARPRRSAPTPRSARRQPTCRSTGPMAAR
ncbi:hypothetical protein TSA66_02835 [Noviherbaspirillum autotrophicum]|uniref:Uncharacterized protein n=1 Tax=Noviherbaspirillum autotrophicum TaxID=709839 RepID=A0A0C2BFI4_9BURK|nr:hypothetical protein TSA66_02835 [Noviherbaspirillum autotrophicum]